MDESQLERYDAKALVLVCLIAIFEEVPSNTDGSKVPEKKDPVPIAWKADASGFAE